MTTPLFEATTKRALEQVVASPPHALLLHAPRGMGKTTVLTWLIAKLDVGPHILHIVPEKGKQSIGIEVIRSIEHFLSLKLPNKEGINRIVTIEEAATLTLEAQNALLKTLEEPPAGTLIILTSSEPTALLPTVVSRLQLIEIKKPAKQDVEAALPAHNERILALSDGLPGLAFSLSANDTDHPLVAAANEARAILGGSSFDRLVSIDQLTKDKQLLSSTVQMLMQMSRAALLTGRGATRWQQVLQASYNAESDLRANVQPKLAATRLMLEL